MTYVKELESQRFVDALADSVELDLDFGQSPDRIAFDDHMTIEGIVRVLRAGRGDTARRLARAVEDTRAGLAP